ncbi:MAG: hypothetical protein QM715_10205 [Nibricoccus sp.]
MITDHILTRSQQLALNGRAVWRDLMTRHFGKLRFHLRGCLRALRN